MFDLSLRDFRGFHRQPHVPIRPITILIGENSAGKSSFLAALQYMMDFLSLEKEPTFNGDPFQLGTFDQISHFRGGRGGRAREFRISLRKDVSLRRSKSSEFTGKFPTEITLTFSSIESHAAVTAVSISSGRERIETYIADESVKIAFVTEKNERFQIDDPEMIPPVARSEFTRYWPFLLRHLQYRIRRRGEDVTPSLFGGALDSSIARLSSLADALARSASWGNEATSAIRTKPQRTYTPGTEKEDGEGSHVPYEIAKLYRARSRNRSAWEDLKSAIESFGSTSEMFKEMTVKSFGQTASDPFQLQFSYDGPRTNIADLGYGTSQVLPLLYSIATSSRRTRLLMQQPEVHLHPKAQAALGQYIVDYYKANGTNFVLETHSDFIVDRIRMAVARGEITRDDVSILFFERRRLENTVTLINLNAAGEPKNPPMSYRSFFIDEQMKLLGV